MNIKKHKYKKNFLLNKCIPFTLIIILLFLTILFFLPEPIFNSQRKLQSIESFQENNITNYTIIEEEKIFYLDTIYIVEFIIFCYMEIYVLIRLKRFPDYIRKRKDDLYTFIYFANNGDLITNILHILFFYFYSIFIIFTPVVLTSLMYIIGGLYFIDILIKSKCFQEQFFSWEHLSSIIKLPCFAWQLITLDDYCCIDTTNETDDEDGHTKSNTCIYLWNLFFKFLKFISYLYAVIVFYVFFIVFIIGWFISKLIYLIVLIFRKNENNISQNEENEPKVENEKNEPKVETKVENNEGQPKFETKVENNENEPKVETKVENNEDQPKVETKVENNEGQPKVENNENQPKVENNENQPKVENNEIIAGAQNAIQSGIVINININVSVNQNFPNENINKNNQNLNSNQNSQNEPNKKLNKKQMKNFDYLNNDEINSDDIVFQHLNYGN